MYPLLAHLRKPVDQMASSLCKVHPSMDSIWQVSGPPGSGKSTFVDELADRIRQESPQRLPIVFRAPGQSIDSGACAFLAAVAQLKVAGRLNGTFAELLDPSISFDQRLNELEKCLSSAPDEIVAILDEPNSWAPTRNDEHRFSAHASRLSRLVSDRLPIRRVIVNQIPEHDRITIHSERFKRQCHAAQWMREADSWGPFSSTAIELLERVGDPLSSRTPVEIRLLVGIAVLSDVDDTARWFASYVSPLDIAKRFGSRLETRGLERLFQMWAALALVRRPFDPSLLKLTSLPELSQLEADLLQHCLLSDNRGHLVLHESLRGLLLLDSRLRDSERCHIHQALGDHYLGTFRMAKASLGVVPALEAQLEAFHHLSLSGDQTAALNCGIFFVDQLDALGQSLSKNHKRYDDAITVFRRALDLDDTDDYAHHYLAFNLDVQGVDPQTVEDHYFEAIRIEPLNVWWWSRYVCFLITRGRMNDSRQAWADAQEALGLPDSTVLPQVFDSLHLWVARLLLHRGQLDFARDVVLSVPPSHRDSHTGFTALLGRIELLLETRQRRAVFPMSLAQDDWWAAPHLAARLGPNRSGVTRWLAARIDQVDDSGVHCTAAEKPGTASTDPSFLQISISSTDFDAWSHDFSASEVEAGRFLEIVYYEGQTAPVIRIHPRDALSRASLPRLWPSPVRYLKNAGMVT